MILGMTNFLDGLRKFGNKADHRFSLWEEMKVHDALYKTGLVRDMQEELWFKICVRIEAPVYTNVPGFSYTRYFVEEVKGILGS